MNVYIFTFRKKIKIVNLGACLLELIDVNFEF